MCVCVCVSLCVVVVVVVVELINFCVWYDVVFFGS